MKFSGRAAIGFVVGGVMLGSLVSVAAQEGTPPKPTPAPREKPTPAPRDKPTPAPRQKQARPADKNPALAGLRGAIRAEVVLPGVDGGPIRTVRSDRGVLKRSSADSVTIAEEDGTTVTVPVNDETRVSRDGERSTAAALKEGDHVFAVRMKDGDGAFTTRWVQAFSPERYREMQQRREACRQNPERCRAEKQAQRAQQQARKEACRANPEQCRAERSKLP